MSTAKRERQKANRAAKLAAEAEARRQRRSRRIGFSVGAVAVVGLLIWGTASILASLGDVSTAEASENPASVLDAFLGQPTACGASAPDTFTSMEFEAPEQLGLTGTPIATIQTSCGPIEIALDADNYPETVNSFAFLSEQGYFDGTACHRMIAGFMLQCGDPTATGGGNPGYVVPDEFPEEGFTYEKGVVAMANAGAGTTGSQFFIVTGDASHLPASYSVLGTVVEGWDTLEAIESVPVSANAGGEVSDPQESIYLESVVVDGR
jgi:peptidyl-prolyl cis-trans isomerase B (cyclophilin B)